MRCRYCNKDFGRCSTITSVMGELMCNECAMDRFSKQELLDLAEEVVPSDIGLMPECEWCGESSDGLYNTDLGLLCGTCIATIRSRGDIIKVSGRYSGDEA